MKESKLKYQESSSTMEFVFEGDGDIDARTFSLSIIGISDLIDKITSDSYPHACAKLKIKSTKPGSFSAELSTVIQYVPDLFTTDNLIVAQLVLQGLLEILRLKQFLGGAQPREIKEQREKYVVKDNKGNVRDFNKNLVGPYFKDAKIDQFTVNIFDSLSNDPARQGLRIRTEDGDELRVTKEEFPQLAKELYDERQIESAESNCFDIALPLKKPDLLGSSKWGFVFMTRSIEADIADEEWLERVHRGEIKDLFAGVKIPVKLLCEYALDKNKMPIKDSERYTVLKVTGDIILPGRNRDLFKSE